MNILLINPPIEAEVPAKSTPLGLGYLAGVLRKRGHTVIIEDFTLRKEFVMVKNRLIHAIGISIMFTQYKKSALELSKRCKEDFPASQTIVGGAHASTFPEECLEYADTVVVGEGEEVICDIVENKLKGIRIAERIRNLDNLPMPAWDLMADDMKEMNRLSKKSPFLMRHPLAHIITSRGCPNNCIFCAIKVVWGTCWIARSPESVVDEIEYLYKLGFREIHFNDDNCSINKQRIYEICEKILKRDIDVRIACPTGIHINTLDKPLLKTMKRAGFYRLCFGIETGSQELQRIIKKNIDLDRARRTIRDANNLGFWTSATFILGFPFETQTQRNNTLEFAKRSNLDLPIFYELIIQPKTELYERYKHILQTIPTSQN